tara:strand:- start:4962 stop:5381 length:420 start_codon:yes stop_codon:yes gene_type:complete
MWNLRKDIIKIISSNNLGSQVLTNEEAAHFYSLVFEKFAKFEKYQYPLWENLKDTVSVEDKDGWQKIDRILGKEEVLLFFEYKDDSSMFKFSNPEDVKTVLGNMHAFVFYVTNVNVDYLLCFNDHDYLIWTGNSFPEFL